MNKSLHVVHVINNLCMGGAEKLMSTLLPSLRAEGISCTLICLGPGAEAPYLQALNAAGIPVHTLQQGSNLYQPGLLLALGRKLRSLKPDLVHAHLFPTLYWTALSAGVFRISTPLLLTEHDTSNRRMESPLLKPLQSLIYRRYREVVCISEGVRNALSENLQGLRLRTIYNGIPLQHYSETVKECRDADLLEKVQAIRQRKGHKLVLSVGRLVEKKNQECMIRCMALLPAHVHLMIAGEGDRRSSLEQLIAELGLQQRVTLLGNRSDIPWLVQQADAGILTSTIEGFGLAAAEMMAGGLPVACSNIPGLGEVAAHPSLLAEPQDEKAFALILRQLLEDEAYHREMQALGREKTRQFSIEHMAAQYATLYREVAANG